MLVLFLQASLYSLKNKHWNINPRLHMPLTLLSLSFCVVGIVGTLRALQLPTWPEDGRAAPWAFCTRRKETSSMVSQSQENSVQTDLDQVILIFFTLRTYITFSQLPLFVQSNMKASRFHKCFWSSFLFKGSQVM